MQRQTFQLLFVVKGHEILVNDPRTWTFRKKDVNRLRAFEMKCLRRILNIKWQEKIKNKDIMKRTGTKINIVQRMIESKLKLFGHICRMQDDGLIKQAVFGIWMGKTRSSATAEKQHVSCAHIPRLAS